jgi:hypothetical protein
LQRVLTTVTLLGLLVATAAAFAITEHLKLTKGPISGTYVTKAFSPVCGCSANEATIRVRLRHPDQLTVTILDSSLHAVATVASNRRRPKGFATFLWNGKSDTGAVVPDGNYRPQIHLANARRTILMPNRIEVDTTAPKVVAASDGTGILTTGGRHTIAIHYVFSERAHAVVFVGSRRVILGHPSRPRAAVKWNGSRGGTPLPAGRYVLTIGAVDAAGNETPASERKQVVVRIRYIAIDQRSIRVAAGAHFFVDVRTAAPKYSWRLARRHGAGHGKLLHLRAPARRGRYRLVVTEHGHSASVRVIVGGRK